MNDEIRAQQIEILLVEDNPGDVRLIREALSGGKMGNHLTVAGDGEEALAILKKEGKFSGAPHMDLVLLDLNLPKIDGKEVLAEIRRDERLKNLPVVVLTTSRAEEDILKAYDLHANCFISKPVGVDEFIKVVQKIEHFWLTIVKFPSCQ
ncbi:MAG TPA: response regulator [Candidatus Omnitrophota bacterium]|nr:response regulator [Candidatus Omnitrophota bacterium]